MIDDAEMTDQAAKLVRCPTCGGDSRYEPANPARPFCSLRCKNIDLGAWANEEFRMPNGPSTPDQDGRGLSATD